MLTWKNPSARRKSPGRGGASGRNSSRSRPWGCRTDATPPAVFPPAAQIGSTKRQCEKIGLACFAPLTVHATKWISNPLGTCLVSGLDKFPRKSALCWGSRELVGAEDAPCYIHSQMWIEGVKHCNPIRVAAPGSQNAASNVLDHPSEIAL